MKLFVVLVLCLVLCGQTVNQPSNGAHSSDKVTWGFCALTSCTAGDAINNPYIVVGSYSISTCYISAGMAPTGADIIVQVNKNGTNAFTVNETAGTANYATLTSSPTPLPVSTGDTLTAQLTQVGSTIAGQYVTLVCSMQ